MSCSWPLPLRYLADGVVVDLNYRIVSHSLGGAHTTSLGHLGSFWFCFSFWKDGVGVPTR
ncbi:hypothetical protein B0T09DRAFT_348124 [Sordaria sp. MPI-SDFR-AT-0083]|nr:hypothetical protein B0T09DRAFT_348124 [Sordaria sp. MPI-SDFR-AT-0083]